MNARPPIGAKVRATRVLNGTTVTVEGVITSAYGRGYNVDPDRTPTIVLAGNEHVSLADTAVHEGIWLASVEVLEVPLPPEPDFGEFVACGTDDNLLPFFRRWHEGWAQVGDHGLNSPTWADICAISQDRAKRYPVRLMPDPAADAPALPWEHEDERGDTLEVDTRATEPTQLSFMVGDRIAWVPRDKAVEAARAILRWAGEQR